MAGKLTPGILAEKVEECKNLTEQRLTPQNKLLRWISDAVHAIDVKLRSYKK